MTNSTTQTVLQSLIFPTIDVWADEQMYIRRSDGIGTSLSRPIIHFHTRGAKLTTDTFYNALAVETWKKTCEIQQLLFRIEGRGAFRLRFGIHNWHQAQKWLHEVDVQLNDESDDSKDIPLPFWDSIESGLLYCSFESLGPATLTGGGYFTTDHPKRAIKLGLVLTHFNRQEQATRAINRIYDNLIAPNEYDGKITLTVIDNSRNLNITSKAGLTVIPNQNYGGSGGFARGLLELDNGGDHTHCLFMDDDASCEIESIRRTFAIFQFNTKNRIAVAGSLLREVEPHRLFEKGARFDGLCRPLGSGLDMREIGDLLAAENVRQPPQYGGWWFFSFNIKEVNHYPFPFFVRGDDSQFSMINKLTILTANGIASFGDDFGLEHSPLTTYLDFRYHIINSILYRIPLSRQLTVMLHFFFGSALSYNYESARACSLALEDILEGPRFFQQNIDPSNVLKKVSALTINEKLRPCTPDNIAKVDERHITHENKLRTLLRWITANGHLTPFLVRNKTVVQPKSFRGKLREVFLYRKVLYRYEPYRLCYLVKYDAGTFWKEVPGFIRLVMKFTIRHRQLRNDYISALPEMTSKQFWESVYQADRKYPMDSSHLHHTSQDGKERKT